MMFGGFGGISDGASFVNGAMSMMSGAVDRVEFKLNITSVDNIMPSASGNEDAEIIFCFGLEIKIILRGAH